MKVTTRCPACSGAHGKKRPTTPPRSRKAEVGRLKVCLATQHADAAFTPLALLYLNAYLVEHLGIPREDVVVLEFSSDHTAADIACAVASAEPDVAGFSRSQATSTAGSRPGSLPAEAPRRSRARAARW